MCHKQQKNNRCMKKFQTIFINRTKRQRFITGLMLNRSYCCNCDQNGKLKASFDQEDMYL